MTEFIAYSFFRLQDYNITQVESHTSIPFQQSTQFRFVEYVWGYLREWILNR